MTAHAVSRGGIKTVVSEKPTGMIGGENLAVEEHAHQVCISGAEFHVMGDHTANCLFFSCKA